MKRFLAGGDFDWYGGDRLRDEGGYRNAGGHKD